MRSHPTSRPHEVPNICFSIAYHTHIAGLTRFDKLSSHTTTYLEQNLEIAVGSLGTKIDPYMGVSAVLISLLHVAAETNMFDPKKPPNLDLMMENVIKMYSNVVV